MSRTAKFTVCAFAAVLLGAAWYGITSNRDKLENPISSAKGAESRHVTTLPATQEQESASDALGSHYWTVAASDSTVVNFNTLRSRAEAGDMIAQRNVAKLYQQCAVFSLSPSNMYAMLDAYAAVRGQQEGAYGAIEMRFATNCSGVDDGQVIPKQAYIDWFTRAAAQGDAYSKIALATENWTSLKPDDYLKLALDAINSDDPEAIFSLGDLLALAPQSSNTAEFRAAMTGPYANYAWGIAACRMGANCGPGSYRMDSLCVNTGICGPGSFENAIRHSVVPAGQQESLDKAIEEVQRVIGKKPS